MNRAAHRSVRYARPKSAAVSTRFSPSSSGRIRPCKCTRVDQLCGFGTGSLGLTSTTCSSSSASTNRLSKLVVIRRTPCSARDSVISALWVRSGPVGDSERRSITVRRSVCAPKRSGLSSRPSALSKCGRRRSRACSSRSRASFSAASGLRWYCQVDVARASRCRRHDVSVRVMPPTLLRPKRGTRDLEAVGDDALATGVVRRGRGFGQVHERTRIAGLDPEI